MKEVEDGDITYDEYVSILDSAKNTSDQLDEKIINDNVDKAFIDFLSKHNMLESYLKDYQTVEKHANMIEEEDKIDDLNPELKIIAEQAREAYKDGDLDISTYTSLLGGLHHTGTLFVSQLINDKFTEEIADETATKLVDWWKHNTKYFVDRGLNLSFANGGDLASRMDPSNLAKGMRVAAKYSPRAIGSGIDLGAQLIDGEDVGDAAIKTTGHLGAAAIGGLSVLLFLLLGLLVEVS